MAHMYHIIVWDPLQQIWKGPKMNPRLRFHLSKIMYMQSAPVRGYNFGYAFIRECLKHRPVFVIRTHAI